MNKACWDKQRSQLIYLKASCMISSVKNALRVQATLILAMLAISCRDKIKTESAQEHRCQATIQSIREDITIRLGGSIYQIQESKITRPPLSPYNKNGEISFSLGSHGNAIRSQYSANIMMRETLLTDYSDRIIKSCPRIVKVTFGVTSTDWIRSHSWINNKYTAQDECLEPRRDRKYNLAWGQQICL